ncbi:hypothetical protein ABPG73_020966 [Tetrahymena malaccensis]
MKKYKIGATLGDGTFGVVMKAVDETNGQVVAIKKMKSKKCPKWEEIIKLPEITSLMKFHHPNIVNLYEIIKHNNELFFVFEYMDQNVYQMTKDREKPFTENQIRNIIYQTLQGLAYIHRHGYFHRDLKPENLLESNNTIKIADFGLAREIRSKPPFTDYVSTRWYRAPEVILRANNYNSPIDIFAIGCIMAELYKLWPLFPGQNELDQILQICKVMGTPSKEEWPEGYKLASGVGYNFPQYKPQPLQELIPNASPEAIDLLQKMLRYSPQKRISAYAALQHPFFSCNIPIPESIKMKNDKILQEGSVLIDKRNFNDSSIKNDEAQESKKQEIQQIDKQQLLKNLKASQSIDNLINDLLQESQIINNNMENQFNNQKQQKSYIVKTGSQMRNSKYKPGTICYTSQN